MTFKEYVMGGAFDSHEMPDRTLDFPTFTKRGKVYNVVQKGRGFLVLAHGGISVTIPVDKFRAMQPKPKSGDTITITFYKGQEPGKPDYQIKSIRVEPV